MLNTGYLRHKITQTCLHHMPFSPDGVWVWTLSDTIVHTGYCCVCDHACVCFMTMWCRTWVQTCLWSSGCDSITDDNAERYQITHLSQYSMRVCRGHDVHSSTQWYYKFDTALTGQQTEMCARHAKRKEGPAFISDIRNRQRHAWDRSWVIKPPNYRHRTRKTRR